MSIGMRIMTGLLALVALSGLASAQNDPCRECDPDGDGNPDNTYGSLDVGAIHGEDETLADSDWAVSHSDDEKGFWTWLSLCLGAFVEHFEEMLGVEIDADANADLFVGEQGADLDATVQADERVCDAVEDENVSKALGDDGSCALGFDRGAAGDLDGETWKGMSEVDRQLRPLDVRRPHVPVPGEHVPSVDEDACLQAERMDHGLC